MSSRTTPAAITATRTEPPNGPHANGVTRARSMAHDKTTARLVGILILAGWITYGPGTGLTESVLAAPDYLANVAASRTTFTLGAVLMLLNSAAVVGIGTLMFPVLKRHSERVAVTYLSTRLLEAVLLAVGVISLLSLIGVSERYGTIGAAAAPAFEALGGVAVQINTLSYQIGMAALGVGSLFFCFVLYRTGLVPRALAALGFVGYAVFAAGMVLELFGFGVGLLLTAPGGLFELVFATWLIVKGFNPSVTGAAR